MPTAQWSDQLETGIALIDAQHKALFQTLTLLMDILVTEGPGKRLDDCLAGIALATIKHFQTEETLMKELDYPARQQHSGLHNELILQVRAIQYQQTKGRPVSMAIGEFLAGWFDHHIKDMDMDYIAFMKASDRSGGPH